MGNKYDDFMKDFDANVQALGQGGGSFSGASAASATDPLNAPVYMGGASKPASGPDRFQGKPIPGAEGGLETHAISGLSTVGEAYDEFHRMSNKQRKAFAAKLEALGVLEPGNYGYGELASLWREAVDEAADIYRASGRKVTPVGYLGLMKQTGMGDSVGTKFDKHDVSTNTETVNDKQTSLSHKQDIRAALRNAFQQELGRDPTRKETRTFTRALRDAQRANPQTTTGSRNSRSEVNRQKNGNQQTSSSSNDNTTTQQSFDPGNYLDNYMDDTHDREMDERRSATTYYDALLGLAGGGA